MEISIRKFISDMIQHLDADNLYIEQLQNIYDE